MHLPQLEQGNHGAGVVGTFFIDRTPTARAGDPLGERLAQVARAGIHADALRPVRDRALARGG